MVPKVEEHRIIHANFTGLSFPAAYMAIWVLLTGIRNQRRSLGDSALLSYTAVHYIDRDFHRRVKQGSIVYALWRSGMLTAGINPILLDG